MSFDRTFYCRDFDTKHDHTSYDKPTQNYINFFYDFNWIHTNARFIDI